SMASRMAITAILAVIAIGLGGAVCDRIVSATAPSTSATARMEFNFTRQLLASTLASPAGFVSCISPAQLCITGILPFGLLSRVCRSDCGARLDHRVEFADRRGSGGASLWLLSAPR